MGRASPSALLPILRSDALARVLAAVLLSDDPGHVRRLATQTSLPYSTVQREIDRLEQAGIVRTTRLAGTRVAHADERYPYLFELRALLLKAFGPALVLGDLLRRVDGVQEAYIHGSWARRYLGEWGNAAQDVDVVVVGVPAVDRVDELAAEAEDRLGVPVQTTIVAPAEWHEPTSGFVRTVKASPRVQLELDSHA